MTDRSVTVRYAGEAPRLEAGTALKAERRGASLDPFVDHTRAADNNAFEEVLLTIATTLDTWRARPDRPAARHEVFDEIGEWLERIDLRRAQVQASAAADDAAASDGN